MLRWRMEYNGMNGGTRLDMCIKEELTARMEKTL